MKPVVNVYKLGLISYNSALKVQYSLFEKSKTKSDLQTAFKRPTEGSQPHHDNSLVLLQHYPVYTIGIRSKNYDQHYVDKLRKTLATLELSAEFVQTNRGGLITFHGPGQLVAYPILNLADFKVIPKMSIRSYVRKLEYTIISTLDKLGIEGAHTLNEYPGVWLGNGNRKIAFIGISCKRYVTMHGISINCNCDLSWFDHIISCGIEGKAITSIKKELKLCNNEASSVETVASAFMQSFEHQFQCEIVENDPIKLKKIN